MWSYYGSKSKLIKYYPKPQYETIIEPFAGTARYALEYWDHDIHLYEKFHKIYEIWKWLQKSGPGNVINLPDIGYKEKIPPYLGDAQIWLIGYCIARGTPRPCTMGHKRNSWAKDKYRIAKNLHKIKNWNINLGDYRDAPDIKATWFIDPPYEVGGYKYTHNQIDRLELAKWIDSRKGQVIVCENTKAKWIKVKPIKEIRGSFKKSIEGVYLR